VGLEGAKIQGLDMAEKLRDSRALSAWIQAEGTYRCRGDFAEVRITQKRREPLDVLCNWMKDMGIDCTIRYRPKLDAYELTSTGWDDVAAIIRLTEPYIIHPDKREQVRKCKELIFAPRKRLDIRVRRARALLTTKEPISPKVIKRIKQARRIRLF
jgi:hypothetical protein